MEGFRDRVVQQADSIARLYLEGERLGQPATREQKEFIQGVVAADYDGRTIVELLQNGHDAHPADRRDGLIEFFLAEDEHEHEHGVLYVANGGQPVAPDDFDSMCRIAMSSKRPDQGIGNKGVGFKSVLQLADSPEVYSREREDSLTFDGFCFRFASAVDFDVLARRVAPDREDLADLLRANVSPLKVTVPLDEVPAHVTRFEREGFATVIRLVLRSPAALRQVREQLAEICSAAVPFHLFLERVGRITVRVRSADGDKDPDVLTRLPCVVEGPAEGVRLQDGSTYLLLRRTVAEAEMLQAIRRSRDEGGLNSGWERWSGDAKVCVAVPLGRPLEHGRLYTFLPMGEDARAPMPAFVNAPFFAQLDRRSLSPSIPLNDLLLTEIARLCARAATNASGLPDGVTLDLVCWTRPQLTRLQNAFTELGVTLPELPLVPVLDLEQRRVGLAAAKLWRGRGTVFTAEAVAATRSAPIVDTSLDPIREGRVSALARDLGLRLPPSPVEIAAFAEAVAETLAAQPVTPGVWADFYDDLAAERLDGTALRGRRILVGDDGKLLPSGDGRSVFVRPASDEKSPASALPAAVRSRLAFVLAGIPWLTADRRKRPGRAWLDTQNLVRDYRTDTVLGLVGSAMQATDSDDDEALRQCLRFAFDLWHRTVRDIGPEAIRDAGLRVPAESGWRPAHTATFGAGWGGTTAETDVRLARLLTAAATVSADLRHIKAATIEPAHLGDIDPEQWRPFLEAAGVRHGLVPIEIPAAQFSLSGSQVADPTTVGMLWSIPASAEDQRRWRQTAINWPRRGPIHQQVRYRPTTGVAILPAQQDWPAFEDEARRLYADLILRGLDSWPDSALEVHFLRDSDHTRPAWPTFATAFLATAEWIPQTKPGQRSRVFFAATSQAWWLREAETPDYLAAPPLALRGLATPRVLSRLARVGVRFWDDPASARSRLDELTDLVARHRSESRGAALPGVRKAYEEAWRQLGDHPNPPHRIVITRHGQLEVTDLGSEGEPVYVCDEAGAAKERLLGQTPVAMLPIRHHRLATQVRNLLQRSGPKRLVLTSGVAIEVIADGVPAAEATYRRLDDIAGHWLRALVLGTVEFQQSSFVTVSDKQLAHADHRLGQCEIAAAESIVASIGGHPIGAGASPRSFLMDIDGKPRIIVAADEADRWSVLRAASGSLAELAGFPQVERSLELALIDLERRCRDDSPTVADVADALRVPLRDLQAVVLDGTVHLSDHSAVVAVLAVIDPGIAEDLRDHREPFEGRDELRAWLTVRLHPTGPDANTVLALADLDDLHAVIDRLNVPLVVANTGFSTLGLPPLHHRDGHARQFAAYLQQQRATIQDRLRDRFVTVAQRGEPLTEYLRLRDLPGLEPDPAWLDRYWDLPEAVLHDRVDTWLNAFCPAASPVVSAPPAALPSVRELRENGHRTAVRATTAARVAVEAWLHRSTVTSTRRPGDPDAVAAAMAVDGSMDFGRLTQTDVIRWLHAHQQWPESMRQVTAPAQLDLSDEDIAQARERLTRAAEQRHRKAITTAYGTRKFGQEPEETQAFIEAVRAAVPAEVLAVPPTPVALPAALPGQTTTGGVGGGGGWRATSAPPEVTERVGLAGELLVGEWIQHQFGYPPETTWRSAYRRTRFPTGGDDRLGYDFEVTTPDKRLLIEVKATADAVPQIALGESEVRRARDLADDEEYVIAFVTHALHPTQRRLHLLPNPLGTGGFQYYRVAGRSMRLQFQLAAR